MNFTNSTPPQRDCRWKFGAKANGGQQREKLTEREEWIDRLLATTPGSKAAALVLKKPVM